MGVPPFLSAADCAHLKDEELARLVLKDKEAFLCLMERYEAKLLRYIRRISAVSTEEAEDVLQEVFLSAYLHIADVDPALSFSSWIYRIAHNRTVSAYRKRAARPQEVPLDGCEDEGDALQLVADADVPLEADRALLRRQVHATLATLPLSQREVLELFYLEGKNYREIGDILRKPSGTVATLLHRAKRAFRDRFSAFHALP